MALTAPIALRAGGNMRLNFESVRCGKRFARRPVIQRIEFAMFVESRRLAMGLAAVLLLAVSSAPAESGFETGVTAYKHGEYKTAMSLFRPLAENGDPKAQTILGLMYSYGEGVQVDLHAASRWYRRAAEQSYGVAQYSLAMLYLEGRGVPVDTDEALRWLTLAAEGGHARAKDQLRQMDSIAYSDLATSGEDPLTARAPSGAAQAGSGDSTRRNAEARSERRSEIFAASRMPTRAAVAPAPPVEAERVTKAIDTEMATAPAAQEPADTKPAAKSRRRYRLQLAASTSEESIRKDWSEFRENHADLFEGLEGRIERAEVGEKKVVWYRLRVGPFSTTAKARELCAKLSQRGLDTGCLTLRATP